jgi:hypothetical protein
MRGQVLITRSASTVNCMVMDLTSSGSNFPDILTPVNAL